MQVYFWAIGLGAIRISSWLAPFAPFTTTLYSVLSLTFIGDHAAQKRRAQGDNAIFVARPEKLALLASCAVFALAGRGRILAEVFLSPFVGVEEFAYAVMEFKLHHVAISSSAISDASLSFRVLWIQHVLLGSSLQIQKVLWRQLKRREQLGHWRSGILFGRVRWWAKQSGGRMDTSCASIKMDRRIQVVLVGSTARSNLVVCRIRAAECGAFLTLGSFRGRRGAVELSIVVGRG